MAFSNMEGHLIIDALIQTIQNNKQYLSDIDGAIGDGDHGINMNKGVSIAQKELDNVDYDLSKGLEILTTALMEKIGGSMGPLYGSFFLGMQMPIQGKQDIEDDDIVAMLVQGYQNLQSISSAKPGDKSLVDVLDPAICTLQDVYKRTHDIKLALNACEKAAYQGMEDTKNMIAKIGRASRLGEKSIGHQDAGATSCYLLLEAFCQTAIKLS